MVFDCNSSCLVIAFLLFLKNMVLYFVAVWRSTRECTFFKLCLPDPTASSDSGWLPSADSTSMLRKRHLTKLSDAYQHTFTQNLGYLSMPWSLSTGDNFISRIKVIALSNLISI